MEKEENRENDTQIEDMIYLADRKAELELFEGDKTPEILTNIEFVRETPKIEIILLLKKQETWKVVTLTKELYDIITKSTEIEKEFYDN